MKKVALITGSKGGIGSAISSQLVNDGYRVIATYFTGNYECALEWFNSKGFTKDQVRLFELDVTNTAECAEKLAQLLEEEGTIDVVVNNAGITRDGVFKKMTAQAWNDVINTNLNSLFNVTQPPIRSNVRKRWWSCHQYLFSQWSKRAVWSSKLLGGESWDDWFL